jgi:hypothetical protein
MPYIGRSTDGFGVRNRFIYLASSGDTSVSGADANGATLTFTDGAYVDVYLNGVLLKAGTDYNTNTANTIAGLSALAANDEVTVIVFDVFTVADMVSATSGGTFSGAVTANSTLDMNGTELILDADADTSITADTDDRIDFRFGGTDSVHMDVTGVGVNLTNPLYPFHARAASGGDTAALFLEGPNDGYSALYMGDTDTIGQNSIVANHATDELVFTTGNKVRFNIGASANTGTAANVDILEAPTYLSMADDSSFTVNLGHAGVIVLSNASTGKAGFFFYQYISGLTELADPSGHLATSDSDGSLCIYKSATNGNNYVIKNRVGSTRSISIAVFATGV